MDNIHKYVSRNSARFRHSSEDVAKMVSRRCHDRPLSEWILIFATTLICDAAIYPKYIIRHPVGCLLKPILLGCLILVPVLTAGSGESAWDDESKDDGRMLTEVTDAYILG